MKTHFTIRDLIKLAGKTGDAMGSSEPLIFFDGRIAVAANAEATLEIDCPAQLSAPLLVAVTDLKTALAVSSDLTLREEDGHLLANGVRVPKLPAEVVPPATRELLDLDRSTWQVILTSSPA